MSLGIIADKGKAVKKRESKADKKVEKLLTPEMVKVATRYARDLRVMALIKARSESAKTRLKEYAADRLGEESGSKVFLKSGNERLLTVSRDKGKSVFDKAEFEKRYPGVLASFTDQGENTVSLKQTS